MFGKDIALPESYKDILEKSKNLFVVVPLNAIEKGEQFTLPISSKEMINGKCLLTLVTPNKENLFVLVDEDVSGKDFSFNIALDKLLIVDEKGQEIIESIPQKNIIRGKLIPNRRHVKLEKKVVNKKVFDYSLCQEVLRPNDEIVSKIYALLGKKFHLHDIEFSFSPEDVELSSEGIKCLVEKNIKFSDNVTFSALRLGEALIYIKTEKELPINEEVYIKLDPDKLGVKDINFDVIII